ncbi:MAG: DUF5615 family PIN-like protein [Deltaproteobacteria bacterium]|nr:DUF5615 family PIN-like protein [Deltaproteobacteria bacterium]
MKLKLDENISRHLKPILQKLNHDVMTAADEGLLSQPDPIIAAVCKEERRILLTLDVEFADLRKYPPGCFPGIILFRPESYGPLAVNHFIENFVANTNLEEFRNCIVVVDATRIRIRRPPSDDQ